MISGACHYVQRCFARLSFAGFSFYAWRKLMNVNGVDLIRDVDTTFAWQGVCVVEIDG